MTGVVRVEGFPGLSKENLDVYMQAALSGAVSPHWVLDPGSTPDDRADIISREREREVRDLRATRSPKPTLGTVTI
jgi:hypothetical protein